MTCKDCGYNNAIAQCTCAPSGLPVFGNLPFIPQMTTGQGWICPRCDRVNAPWMPCCLCNNKDKK